MKSGVIISGYGGQGVMLAGKILCEAAMREDKYVTFFPSYGAEMRGGTANCQIIISTETIGAPVVECPDILLSLNAPSLDKFYPKLERPDGTAIVNSSLLSGELPSEDIFSIPANRLAIKSGNVRAANMVMLGAASKLSEIVSIESLQKALSDALPRKKKNLLEININALKSGYDFFG